MFATMFLNFVISPRIWHVGRGRQHASFWSTVFLGAHVAPGAENYRGLFYTAQLRAQRVTRFEKSDSSIPVHL